MKPIVRLFIPPKQSVWLAFLVGPPICAVVILIVLFGLAGKRHVDHYHAVAARLAKAKPDDWKELATACQTMVDYYEHGGASVGVNALPLPPALQALAPASPNFHEGRFDFEWTGGFDDGLLLIEFEHGVLKLIASQIPGIELPVGETQMWPVAPAK